MSSFLTETDFPSKPPLDLAQSRRRSYELKRLTRIQSSPGVLVINPMLEMGRSLQESGSSHGALIDEDHHGPMDSTPSSGDAWIFTY